jgi:T-complex protein 1 subunit beta
MGGCDGENEGGVGILTQPRPTPRNSNNPEAFRSDLFNIARTTLSSKVLAQDKEYFANLAVDAVLRLKVGPRPRR